MKNQLSHHHYVKYIYIFPCIVFFTIHCLCINAQTPEKPEQKTGFQLFFEKVYLHLDRTMYASGEDIWFKAYLVNAQSNYLTGTSINLYVELISPGSEIIDRKTIRLENGTGTGDFKLSDSIAGGKYRIRSYTNWMKNFRDCFIFEKEIEISGNQEITSKIQPQAFDSTKFEMHFFPEGGSLIEDVPTTVAFKAADQLGRGCEIKGAVINTQGDTATVFKSTNHGMGKFDFFPMNGQKYYATGKIKGLYSFRTELPAVLPNGFVLRTKYIRGTVLVSIAANQSAFEEFRDKDLFIVGRSYGKVCFKSPMKLTDRQMTFRVPESNFPGGIASITLYDPDLHPQAERIVYTEPNHHVKLNITTDKNIYRGRERVILNLQATDEKGNPVKTNLSVSAVDGSVVTQDQSDIRAYLLLNSEIRGNIENPSSYFDTLNANRLEQLDLLLMTQGWRNYLWKQVTDSVIKLRYMVEPGFTISGRVRQKFADKPVAESNVTMFLPGAKTGTLMFTKTDSSGRYYFDGVEFYGNKKLILTTKNSKGKDAGWILKNPESESPLKVPEMPVWNIPAPLMVKFSEEAQNKKKTLKKYSLSDIIELDEVVVKAKSKREQDQENSHVAIAGFADYIYKISEEDKTFSDIGMYLLDKVPGAMPAEPDANNSNPSAIAFRSAGQEIKPRFILDNFEIDSSDEYLVYNLSMYQIERIMISRSDPLKGNLDRFVISIFTNPNASSNKKLNVIQQQVTGYYEAREFYSPAYTRSKDQGDVPDLRTTICWNPKVETDAHGRAVISFFNADKPVKVNVRVEGISNNGIPVTGNTNYVVREK